MRGVCESENILLGRRALVDILTLQTDDASLQAVLDRVVRRSERMPETFREATGRIVVDLRSRQLQEIHIYFEIHKDSGADGDSVDQFVLRRVPLYPGAHPRATLSTPAAAMNRVGQALLLGYV